MRKIKDGMISLLNKFCFCKWHEDNCNGCIFKKFDKCPLNTVITKLEE